MEHWLEPIAGRTLPLRGLPHSPALGSVVRCPDFELPCLESWEIATVLCSEFVVCNWHRHHLLLTGFAQRYTYSLHWRCTSDIFLILLQGDPDTLSFDFVSLSAWKAVIKAAGVHGKVGAAKPHSWMQADLQH